MTEKPKTATLYIWEKSSKFSMDELIFLLGGQQIPRDDELAEKRAGRPKYFTADLMIYATSKEEDEKTKRWNNPDKPLDRLEKTLGFMLHFKTDQIKERFENYDLPLPDYEIDFHPRRHFNTDGHYDLTGVNYNLDTGIDTKKIISAAAHLFVYSNLDVLLVPGTSIEEDQLFASETIAQKLGIPMIPEVMEKNNSTRINVL